MSVDRSTVWPYVDGEPGEFIYSRYAHPTGVEAERELGELEGGRRAGAPLRLRLGRGHALAARAARAGADGRARRGRVLRYRRDHATSSRRWGLRHVEFDQTGSPPDGADLVWLEAPSNPFLTMPDLEAAAAHTGPVSSSTRPPPRRSTSDRSSTAPTSSCTARRSTSAGHSDALAGAVVCRDADDHERLLAVPARARDLACAADVAALVSRGLKTLRVRVERQTETAGALAERLRAPSGGRDRPLSRVRRPALVRRRRRRGAGRDVRCG